MDIGERISALDGSIEFLDGLKLYRQAVKAGLPADLQKVRIAILANVTLDQFSIFLRLFLLKQDIDAEIWISEFDVIDQYFLDRSSQLHEFKPDIVWIFTDERLLPGGAAGKAHREAQELETRLAGLWEIATREIGAFVIQNNLVRPVERVFGGYEPRQSTGRSSFVMECNRRLAAADRPGLAIFDLEFLSSLHGKLRWQDDRLWYSAKLPFDPNLFPAVAHQASALIAANLGRAKKVVVLDLDNTLWGGVIGDDGLGGIKIGYGAEGEAFVAFQKYLLGLKQRGVLLAVCSKNDESNARQPFEQHPDMVLRPGDISCFRANWDDKAGNIAKIAEELNLGLDSFVFIDDNPAERKIVRDYLPAVAVPELPSDPALYARFLDQQNYFELTTLSREDADRARMYKENAARLSLQSEIVDIDEYLTSLEMSASVARLGSATLARASQLICKSNQFHLTTTRYSEPELEQLAGRPNHTCLTFRLKDRFGDNGLIGVVLLIAEAATLTIDTWVMSCRVLSRGMEEFILESIADTAKASGCDVIRGIYRETRKNGLVKDLYPRLGATRTLPAAESGDQIFEFEVALLSTPQHHIKRSPELDDMGAQ